MTGEVISKPVRISRKDGIRNVNPVWSPDGRYIAYLEDGKFNYQLGNRYVLVIHDTETGQYEKLETGLYGIPHDFWWNPLWAPSENNILLNGSKKDFQRGYYLVDIENGKESPVLVTKSEPREFRSSFKLPQYAENGEDLYYMSKDNKTILKRNLESGKESQVFSSEHQIVSYCISPGEEQIVIGFWFHNRNRLYSVPVSGGTLREFVELENNQRPRVLSWTSDKAYVIIGTRNLEDQNSHKIIRVPSGGGDPEHIIHTRDLFPKGYFREVDIHPESGKTLFVLDTGNDTGVWALENLLD
jgi:hypothetical protein